MKQIKRLAFGALISSAILLTACQSQPNTLTFTPPPPPTAVMNVHQSAVVFVNVRDMRPQQEIASYTADGQLVKLTASPNVTQLFQQIQQQDLVSKGFRIGQAQNSNASVTVDINAFYAKVEQGSLRYNLDSKVQVTVHVQGAKGQFSKNINANRSYSGAFSAKNPEIQKVLGETFNEVVNSIYRDQEIANAINQVAQ